MPLPTPSDDTTALVTGASSGIGVEIARELSRRGHHVTLLARREDRLREVAEEIGDADFVACDLTDPEARAALPQTVKRRVAILVNNAGFGTGGPFHESDHEQELRQIRLLCEAPVDLCGLFLRDMVTRGEGGILNVASTAGMQPLPFSAGYGAAKAHLLSFTEALHGELRNEGVSVTALCPGPVETEFFEKQNHPVEEAVPKFAWVPAEQVAAEGVQGLEDGKRVVVPGLVVRAGVTAGGYVPNFIKLRLVEWRFGNASEEVME